MSDQLFSCDNYGAKGETVSVFKPYNFDLIVKISEDIVFLANTIKQTIESVERILINAGVDCDVPVVVVLIGLIINGSQVEFNFRVVQKSYCATEKAEKFLDRLRELESDVNGVPI